MRLLYSFLVWFLFFLYTVIILIIVMPLLFFKNTAIIKVAVFWSKITAFMLGIKVQSKGMDDFYKDGSCIILSNHQSLLDIIVLLSTLPVRFTFMAKTSLFKIPFFGWGMRAADCIPVARDNRKKAQESLYHAADVVREKGIPLIIYPEGTFGFADGSLRAFKKGGFVLAQKAGVVLQPLTIWGTANVVPIQPGKWIQRIYPNKVNLLVHKPLQPAEFKQMNTNELSLMMRKIIERPIVEFQKKQPLINATTQQNKEE